MEMRSKEFSVRAEAPEVTAADLELINQQYALRPLQAEEVYVRRLALCNDRYDRTSERFPRSYLERFAVTLPGKPLLAHHDKLQFPIGRFFKAEVVVEPDAGGSPITWLYSSAYLVKTPANEEVRAQIDAGVYSHVSIGYRWADVTCDLCGRSYFSHDCAHVIDQVGEDGRRCAVTYSGDLERVEAVEGSLVYLGAQYGAVVTKSDDRRAEKEKLRGGAPADPRLEGDGRLYRQDLRGEIIRLARCLHAEREAVALLETLGEVPASRLKQVVEDYRRRFDGIFPPEDEDAPPLKAATGLSALPE